MFHIDRAREGPIEILTRAHIRIVKAPILTK